MFAAPTEESLVRIGELSRRTGVRADTIRAWERRYGLLDPARSPAGYRLYSPSDEAVLHAMRRLTAEGLAAAQAATVARRGIGVSPEEPGHGALEPSAQAALLRVALEAFDEDRANAILDESLAALTLDRFAEDVVLGAMHEIGERWESGEVSVAQEHFASALVRGRLLGLARGWGSGAGPLALLACLPGELHDLGLICFGLSLRGRGWRIAYLGPDTPIDTLAGAVESLQPSAVVLATMQPEQLADAAPSLGALASNVRIAVGGPGAETAQPISGLDLLKRGPAEEATALATSFERG